MLERIGHREMAAFDRAIDLRINRIRRKIEVDPEHPRRSARCGRRLHVRPAAGLAIQ
jgi:DNA-binding response OmpR family regulator